VHMGLTWLDLPSCGYDNIHNKFELQVFMLATECKVFSRWIVARGRPSYYPRKRDEWQAKNRLCKLNCQTCHLPLRYRPVVRLPCISRRSSLKAFYIYDDLWHEWASHRLYPTSGASTQLKPTFIQRANTATIKSR
jgi:hypothetical protein